VCEDLRPESDEECARWWVGEGAVVKPDGWPMSTADEDEYCIDEAVRDIVRRMAAAGVGRFEDAGLIMSR
jgi:hypothetical protein